MSFWIPCRLALVVLTLLLMGVGCSSPRHRGYDTLSIYPALLRATDPGFSGLSETFDFVSRTTGGLSDYPAHLKGGVDGAAVYRWIPEVIDSPPDRSHWRRFVELIVY